MGRTGYELASHSCDRLGLGLDQVLQLVFAPVVHERGRFSDSNGFGDLGDHANLGQSSCSWNKTIALTLCLASLSSLAL